MLRNRRKQISMIVDVAFEINIEYVAENFDKEDTTGRKSHRTTDFHLRAEFHDFLESLGKFVHRVVYLQVLRNSLRTFIRSG